METTHPQPRENYLLWLIKILSGAVVIIVLGIHLVVNHLVAPGGLLTYADVIQYYQNPIIPAMEILFLIVVVSHALIGMRSILLDLHPSRSLMKLIDPALIFIGGVSIVYGIWLVLTLVSRG